MKSATRKVLIALSAVLAVTASGNEVWRPAPLGSVRLGGALGERFRRTLDGNLMKLDLERDFIEQFRTKTGKKSFIGTGNVVEALVCCAKYTGDPDVIARKRQIVDALIAAQGSDGYIGCMDAAQRVWRQWDAEDVGFVLDGLVLDWTLFGERKSLDAAVRAADYMLGNWKNPPAGFDALIYDKELLMGLSHGVWALYEATGDARYREFLTKTFDHLDWDMPLVLGRACGLKGHTAGYLDTCLTQLEMFRTLGDRRLFRQFTRFADHYFRGNGGLITGHEGVCECFTADQDGSGCCGETCMSAYALCVFDLALRTGAEDAARAGNAMERILHNGFFAAQSRDGRKLRYYTPLSGVRRFWPSDDYCCPCNYRRVMGHLPSYVFYANDAGVLANLYTAADAELTVGGTRVSVREETDYPSEGRVRFTVRPERDTTFEFALRIPEWCGAVTPKVNGEDCESAVGGSIWRLSRTWRSGDVLEVEFPMDVRLVRGRARQGGRFALMRGPLVYALDLRPFSVGKTESVESANSDGVRLEDVFVAYPETFRVVPDDSARPGGTAILAKGSLVSFQLGPDHASARVRDFRFTEFPSEGNTMTYFRVPDPVGCGAVDDALFTGRRE